MRASVLSGSASNHTATRGAHSVVTGQGGNNLIYNLPQHFNCQSMSAVTSDTDTHRFLMGTCSLHKPNEIHLVSFNEDANRVDLQKIFRTPEDNSFQINEVNDLRACPYQSQKGYFACSHKGIISIFQIADEVFEEQDDDEGKDVNQQDELIQEMCQLRAEKGETFPDNLQSVFWEDMEAKDDKTATDLLACSSQYIHIWDVKHGALSDTTPKTTIKCSDLSCDLITGYGQSFAKCKSVKRNPHNPNIFAFTYGKRFELFDQREGPKKRIIQDTNHLHSPQQLLDLDFNPIKLNVLATSGQDSTVRFWDIRKDKINTGECLLDYNPTQTSTNKMINRDNERERRKTMGKKSLLDKASSSMFSKGSNSIVGIQASNTIAQQFQSHWITKIRFNLSHDQLLLTSDTATFINLYKFQSVSSAPTAQMESEIFGASRSSAAQVSSSAPERPSYLEKYMDSVSGMHNYSDSDDSGSDKDEEADEARKSGLAFEKEERFKKQGMGVEFGDVIENEIDDADMLFQNDSASAPKDELIQRNELEDSVMAIDWSAVDTWTFAGVSYNGTFFLNTVPSKVKYEILI